MKVHHVSHAQERELSSNFDRFISHMRFPDVKIMLHYCFSNRIISITLTHNVKNKVLLLNAGPQRPLVRIPI